MTSRSHPNPAPLPTLGRLPSYYRLLQTLRGQGETAVSCTRIAETLDLDPTSVRKDLACTGITGKPRVGYDLVELMEAVSRFLGWGNSKEAFLVGAPDPLATVLARLRAFADAGADCLFAPGLSTPQEVTAVVAAVAPKPVNVLAVDPSWMTLASLGDLGVRRISVGSALARTGWRGFMQAARDVAATGSFRGLENAESFESLNALFARPD